MIVGSLQLVASTSVLALALNPATVQESASVFGSSLSGASDALAESVSVNPTFDRGTGLAFARTGNVYPLIAEVGVDLVGADSPAAFGGSGTARIVYQFGVEALGPGVDRVPIVFSAAGLLRVAAANELVGSQSYTVLDYPNGRWALRSCDASGCYSGTWSFDESDNFDVDVDTAYTVQLDLLTHGQGGGLGFSYDSYAMLDPVITIDPGFLDKDNYRIVYSAGIAPIPLPVAWILIASALGFVARQRRGPIGLSTESMRRF